MDDHHYKHREDLIDACLAAWTAALWVTAGPDRVHILGADDASWTSEGSAPRSSRLLGPNRGCPSQHGVISAPRQLLKGLDSNFGVSYGSAQTLLQVVHSGSGDIRRGTRGNRG